jgi:peptidoglycan hydrolase-like protein with peptidoglycan-binding domain
MLPGRLKLQLFVFLVLSGGVAANIFIQAERRNIEEERLLSASAQRSGPRQTGSIEGAPLTGIGAALRSAPAAAGSSAMIATLQIPEDTMDVTRAVQRELQARGYETGGSDGVPSLLTSAAVMGFEHDHGLPLTGRPSQELLKYILLGGNAEVMRTIKSSGAETSPEAVTVIRTVQKSLAKLGYRPGRADGRMSEATARAIREFEVDQALPESGRISGPLYARLTRLTGKG